jgi:NAD(P)H-dependent FMN reductase
MDSSPLRLGIIIASVRRNRRGEGIGKWFHRLAAAREGVDPVLLDLVDYRLPDFEAPTGARAAEASYELDAQRRWVAAVSPLDAFAVVTPEYNHGYPASLKNALDHVHAGWRGKPMGFVSYGGISGGTRCVQQLRLVAVELACAPLREEVNIPLVYESLDDQGAPRDPYYVARAGALLDALLWWGHALRDARVRAPLPPPPPPIMPKRAA